MLHKLMQNDFSKIYIIYVIPANEMSPESEPMNFQILDKPE